MVAHPGPRVDAIFIHGSAPNAHPVWLRFALDIMRSVLQTAVAAHAPLQEYILSVLRASPADVAAAPTQFTPREWVAQMARSPAAP